MPSPFAMGQMLAALENTDFDVQAAFEYIQASGKATEELDGLSKDMEALKADVGNTQKRLGALRRQFQLEQARTGSVSDPQLSSEIESTQQRLTKLLKELEEKEDRYAVVYQNRLKRKQEKAESRRLAAESAKEIASETESDASASSFDMDPERVVEALRILKLNLPPPETVLDNKGRPGFLPFWFNEPKPSSEQIRSVTTGTVWMPLDERLGEPEPRVQLKGLVDLDKIDGKNFYFKPRRGKTTRVLKTTGSFLHGVLVTDPTPSLPPLIQIRNTSRFKLARKLDEGLLDSVRAIIPGTLSVSRLDLEKGYPTVQAYEKRGKGQILKNGVIKIVNVDGNDSFFAFKYNMYEEPELMCTTTAKSMNSSGRKSSSTACLTETTIRNVMTLFRAWNEYAERNLEQIGTLNRVSPAVRDQPYTYEFQFPENDIDEDPELYIGKAQADKDQRELKRQRQEALDQAAERRLQQRIADGDVSYGALMIKERSEFGVDNSCYWNEFYRVISEGEGELTNGRGGLAVRQFNMPNTPGYDLLPKEEDLQPDILYRSGLRRIQPGETSFKKFSSYR